MPFVKLDCAMLTSSLWPDMDGRMVFITALLMAEPRELTEPTPTLKVRSLDDAGFTIPPGWYGFVPAAGVGIVRYAGMEMEPGMAALERLASPDQDSRSGDHAGRRMVRVDHGYIILNYQKFRDRDYGAAERMRAFRARVRQGDPYRDEAIAKTGGICPCCSRPFEKPLNRYVVLDHNHETLQTRAYICQSCNKLVGQFELRKTITHADSVMVRAYLSVFDRVRPNTRTVTPNVVENNACSRNDTQAEVEAEAEAEAKSPPTPPGGGAAQTGDGSMLISEGGDSELTPLWLEYLLGSGPDNRRLFDRHVRAALRASKGKVTFAHVSAWMSANPGRKAWDIYEALVPKLEKAPSPAEKPSRSLQEIADDYDKAQKVAPQKPHPAPCKSCRGSGRSTQRRPIDQSSPYWRPEKPFVDVVVPCPECSKKEA